MGGGAPPIRGEAQPRRSAGFWPLPQLPDGSAETGTAGKLVRRQRGIMAADETVLPMAAPQTRGDIAVAVRGDGGPLDIELLAAGSLGVRVFSAYGRTVCEDDRYWVR